MVTERQMLANRLNAQRSTGPRTAEGKAVTRANALKHGLAARTLLPAQDAEAVAERSAQWNSSLRPNNPWELWLVERIAVESLRADRCTREESSLRDKLALRAETCWDEDRRAEAEATARGLARDPASTRSALEATRFGCEWLIACLGELLAALLSGPWDEGQAGRARDLLGSEATADGARAEVDRLKCKLDQVLIPLDEADRSLAESGMGLDPDGAIRRVRRYETSCLRRLEWAFAQLKKGRREAAVADPEARQRHAPRFEIEDDDPDPYGYNDPYEVPQSTDRGSVEDPSPRWLASAGAAPAVQHAATAPARSCLSLAGAMRDADRGPQPGGNRRSRRAARRAEARRGSAGVPARD